MSQTLDQQLIEAAKTGDFKAAERALLAGADIHADYDGVLKWASYYGHANVVVLLLDSGADIHADQDDALMWAVENGHTGVVVILLRYGANIHAKDDYALQLAAKNGNLDMVELLLKSGADVHADKGLVLRLAAENEDSAEVALLLKHGACLTAICQIDMIGKSPVRHVTGKQITNILKQHAATAHRGIEAVMLLKSTPRIDVLRHLYPELKPKQIREELSMLEALGLDAAQMAEMWKDRYRQAITTSDMQVGS